MGGDEEMGVALDTYLVQTDSRRCRDGEMSLLGESEKMEGMVARLVETTIRYLTLSFYV